MPDLRELVQELATELQQKVQDFVEFLLEKKGLKLNWRGALRDLRKSL